MRSGRTKVTRKMRFVLTHVDAGRVSRKTGLPASFILRVKRRKVKTVPAKVERKLSRLYEKIWRDRLEKGGVTESQAEYIVDSDFAVKDMENIVDQNRAIAEQLVENRNRRDENMPKYNLTWHTIEDVLEQMSSPKMESWTINEWLSYTKRRITPALNRGRFFETLEHRKGRRKGFRKKGRR